MAPPQTDPPALRNSCVPVCAKHPAGRAGFHSPHHQNRSANNRIPRRRLNYNAIGMLPDGSSKIGWDNSCSRPFQPGQTSTVPNAGKVVPVITSSGVYGDTTTVDELYRRYLAKQTVWRKWQDLAKSYSSDSKRFVEQITSALAGVTVPPDPLDPRSEDFGTWIALKLLKGNILNLGPDSRRTAPRHPRLSRA